MNLTLSHDLVKRIKAGDETAWEDLYIRYRDPLLFSIRCRLGSALRTRLQSEDILHSVIKDALSDLERFEPRGPKALEHYLHVCVLNKIRKKAVYFGAEKRFGEVRLSPSIASRLPAAEGHGLRYLDEDRYQRLEKHLEQIPPDMREAILLRRIEGLSNAAAAESMGKSPEAVSKLYNRGLARLGVLESGIDPGPRVVQDDES